MPDKLTGEVMKDLMKSRGKAPAMEEEPAEMAEEGSYESDEVAAMQDFEDATTPEEKATALKAFLEICVPRIVGKG